MLNGCMHLWVCADSRWRINQSNSTNWAESPDRNAQNTSELTLIPSYTHLSIQFNTIQYSSIFCIRFTEHFVCSSVYLCCLWCLYNHSRSHHKTYDALGKQNWPTIVSIPVTSNWIGLWLIMREYLLK